MTCKPDRAAQARPWLARIPCSRPLHRRDRHHLRARLDGDTLRLRCRRGHAHHRDDAHHDRGGGLWRWCWRRCACACGSTGASAGRRHSSASVMAGYSGAFYMGLEYMPVALTVLTFYTYPIITGLFAWLTGDRSVLASPAWSRCRGVPRIGPGARRVGRRIFARGRRLGDARRGGILRGADPVGACCCRSAPTRGRARCVMLATASVAVHRRHLGERRGVVSDHCGGLERADRLGALLRASP